MLVITMVARRINHLKFVVIYFFRILWKKNEVADYEATTFSIFYNNALFLVFIIVASFYVLRSFSPTMYPFDIYLLIKII